MNFNHVTILFQCSRGKQEAMAAAELRGQDLNNRIIFFEEQKELLTEVENRPFDYFLYIDNNNATSFDLHFFLSQKRQATAVLLDYQVNVQQPLATIDENYLIKDISVKDDYYYDGLVDSKIYCSNGQELKLLLQRGEKSLVGQLGIPVGKYYKAICREEQKPALFIDRDGVINVDNGYVYKAEEIKFCSDVIPLIRLANERGWYVVVLTNQSGIGKAKYQEEDVDLLHKHMGSWFARHNTKIDGLYYCPYHQQGHIEKYRKRSLLRKPLPGMLLKACQQFAIDIERSFMIGDKISDAILMPGLNNLHIQGNYDLSDAANPVFHTYQEVTDYIFYD